MKTFFSFGVAAVALGATGCAMGGALDADEAAAEPQTETSAAALHGFAPLREQVAPLLESWSQRLRRCGAEERSCQLTCVSAADDCYREPGSDAQKCRLADIQCSRKCQTALNTCLDAP